MSDATLDGGTGIDTFHSEVALVVDFSDAANFTNKFYGVEVYDLTDNGDDTLIFDDAVMPTGVTDIYLNLDETDILTLGDSLYTYADGAYFAAGDITTFGEVDYVQIYNGDESQGTHIWVSTNYVDNTVASSATGYQDDLSSSIM